MKNLKKRKNFSSISWMKKKLSICLSQKVSGPDGPDA
jgi:hypothetical protein